MHVRLWVVEVNEKLVRWLSHRSTGGRTVGLVEVPDMSMQSARLATGVAAEYYKFFGR